MILLDRLAQRYGRLPHELLDLEAYDFTLALMAAKLGGEQDERDRKRAEARGGR